VHAAFIYGVIKMKRPLTQLSLAILTFIALAADAGAEQIQRPTQRKIEAVFVLDTTGSMSGLISAAKAKIWAIANTLAQADPAPEIRVGLVGYRDRGDEYVTKIIQQTADLDATYRMLMDFQANGGGDGPESVNQALAEAVNKFEWDGSKDTYKVIFLVGDAPPHMDYQDDVKYQAVLENARSKGIVVNAVQCGQESDTTPIWKEIAKLGGGEYFQVQQDGDAFVAASPYDDKLAELSRKRDATRLVWGSSEEQKKEMARAKVSEEIAASAPAAALASRATFNASEAGKLNFEGGRELVADVASGKVDLKNVPKDDLPVALQNLSVEERAKAVESKLKERRELDTKIAELSEKRQSYLADEVRKQGKDKTSLDARVFSAVQAQAAKKGIVYSGGPSY